MKTAYSENCVKINIRNGESGLSPREKVMRFAIVNARSVNNKTAILVDHILEEKIDICVVTETWLKDVDSVSIVALSPPGYYFKHFSRKSDRKGGGTGVLYNEIVKIKFVDGEEKRSFEFSEWNCKIVNHTVKLIAVYRPPYSLAHAVTSNMFFEEFTSFLENVVMCPEILLITGDFNFHMD